MTAATTTVAGMEQYRCFETREASAWISRTF
jgi:hypothetical protein